MWKVEIVRVYKSSNLLYEHEDKVIFEVNSLVEASEITSMLENINIRSRVKKKTKKVKSRWRLKVMKN